jgi:hypothetical protein
MSRSNPTVKNPATRFFQWRGGEEGGGKVTWYDKEAEQEETVKLPLTFLVLDELVSVSGYNDNEKSSFWSNEVRNVTKDTLTVRTKSGVKYTGKYKDMNINGAKYAQSVYIAYKDDAGEFSIGNIKIMGAALTQWIDLKKKFEVDQIAVFMNVDPEVKTKGATKYFIPTFEAREVSAATDNEAKVLDATLQAYLHVYLNSKPEEEASYATTTEELNDQNENPEVETTTDEVPIAKTPKESDGEDPIDTQDVPF